MSTRITSIRKNSVAYVKMTISVSVLLWTDILSMSVFSYVCCMYLIKINQSINQVCRCR